MKIPIKLVFPFHLYDKHMVNKDFSVYVHSRRLTIIYNRILLNKLTQNIQGNYI